LDKQSFHRILLSSAAICLLSAAAFAARAEPGLVPYSAEYKVKISVLSGRLTTDLRLVDEGFEAIHVIKPLGLAKMVRNGVIAETSQFSTSGGEVRASWYRSEDSLSKKETVAEVTFDWDAQELSGLVNDEDVQFDLEGLVHDRVAIQYQLMHDLLNGTAEDRYILYDIDEFKTLVISNIGERQIKTPAGNFKAIGIQHRKENSSRVTTLWCVEELGYLPVLIEQHRDGKLRMQATLREYNPLTT
jgi:hypothetical protein